MPPRNPAIAAEVVGDDQMEGPMTTRARGRREPRALSRVSGCIVSATYACATPVVPPPAPDIPERRASDTGKPKIT